MSLGSSMICACPLLRLPRRVLRSKSSSGSRTISARGGYPSLSEAVFEFYADQCTAKDLLPNFSPWIICFLIFLCHFISPYFSYPSLPYFSYPQLTFPSIITLTRFTCISAKKWCQPRNFAQNCQVGTTFCDISAQVWSNLMVQLKSKGPTPL